MLLATLGLSWVEYPWAEPVCTGKYVNLSAVKWQVGKRQIFHCKKYWKSLFLYAATPSGAVPSKNIKTPFAGLK